MTTARANAALLVLVTAVAVVVFVRASSGPRLSATDPHGGLEATIPSSGNVSHAVRVEIAALEEVLAETPEDTTSLLRLARLLHDGHQLEQAARFYERFLKITPKDRQAWLDLANVYAGLNLWDQAFAATKAHLRIMPGDMQATYNLGAIHANLGELDEARRYWEDVRRESTDSVLTAMATRSLFRIQ